MQECRKTSNQIKLASIVASTLSAEEAQLPLSHGAVILSKAHSGPTLNRHPPPTYAQLKESKQTPWGYLRQKRERS